MVTEPVALGAIRSPGEMGADIVVGEGQSIGVGLQFGGKWTEGTGHTENGLCIDGRLNKIGNELEWAYDWGHPTRPWRVRDPIHERVDAVLTPTHDKHSRTNLGLLSMEVHQCFGMWAGRVVTDDGEEIAFDGVIGFAEEARNRW